MATTKCKYCGLSNLEWRQQYGLWRLYTGDLMHQCRSATKTYNPSPEILSYLQRVPSQGKRWTRKRGSQTPGP